MPTLALVIWIAALVVVVLVIVPVAIGLLRRTLFASRAIERYLHDMEMAGAKIATHTAAVPALDDTLAAAGAMVGVAGNIEGKTDAARAVLAARASEARA